MNDRYILEITRSGEFIITFLPDEPVASTRQARGPCGPTIELAENNRTVRVRFISLECLGKWIERFGGSMEFATRDVDDG